MSLNYYFYDAGGIPVHREKAIYCRRVITDGWGMFVSSEIIDMRGGSDREIAKESKVYLREGEEPPVGVGIQVGPRGGRYYIGSGREASSGEQLSEVETRTSEQSMDKPGFVGDVPESFGIKVEDFYWWNELKQLIRVKEVRESYWGKYIECVFHSPLRGNVKQRGGKESYDKSRVYYYDADVVDENLNIVDERYVVDTLETTFLGSSDIDPEYIWRGISADELDYIIKNKRIQSLGKLNFTWQGQKTYYAQYPSQAKSYATSFTAWYDNPTFGRPGYVLKVKKPQNAVINEVGEVEVETPVSFSDVVEIHEFRMIEEREGVIDFVNERGKWTEGSRGGSGHRYAYRKLSDIEVQELSGGVQKEKKYLKPGEQPPEGKTTKTGPKGGVYYETEPKSSGVGSGPVGEFGEFKTGDKIDYKGDEWTIMAFYPITHEVMLRRGVWGEGTIDERVSMYQALAIPYKPETVDVVKPEDSDNEIEYMGRTYTPDSVMMSILENGEDRMLRFHIEDWNVSTLSTALIVRERIHNAWANKRDKVAEALSHLNEIRFVERVDGGKYNASWEEPGVLKIQTRGFAGLPERADMVLFNVFYGLGMKVTTGSDDVERHAEIWADERVGGNPYTYERFQEVEKSVRRRVFDWGEVNDSVQSAVKEYTGSHYARINRFLRATEGVEWRDIKTPLIEEDDGDEVNEAFIASMKMRINLIDEFIEKMPKYEGECWRGMRLSDDELDNWEMALKEKQEGGESIEFPGYLSSTIRRDLAEGFRGSCGVLFRIVTNTGVPVDGLGPSHEDEVLIGRGKKFKVLSVERKRGTDSRDRIHLEVMMLEV